jgi:hypothetical protein
MRLSLNKKIKIKLWVEENTKIEVMVQNENVGRKSIQEAISVAEKQQKSTAT